MEKDGVIILSNMLRRAKQLLARDHNIRSTDINVLDVGYSKTSIKRIAKRFPNVHIEGMPIPKDPYPRRITDKHLKVSQCHDFINPGPDYKRFHGNVVVCYNTFSRATKFGHSIESVFKALDRMSFMYIIVVDYGGLEGCDMEEVRQMFIRANYTTLGYSVLSDPDDEDGEDYPRVGWIMYPPYRTGMEDM